MSNKRLLDTRKHQKQKRQQQQPAANALAALRALLSAGIATSQEGICEALAKQGHQVTQSKVSRWLRKVGAVKSKNEAGQIVYRLPLEPAPPTLDTRLSTLIVDVVANESCIVIQTVPGAGQLIARLLDHYKKKLWILGNIAGDDTIFVAPASVKQIKRSTMAIKQLLL